MKGLESTARAGNRRFWLLSALRAHTKAPYKIDFHRKTRTALNRPRDGADSRHRLLAGPLLHVRALAHDRGVVVVVVGHADRHRDVAARATGILAHLPLRTNLH